MLMDQFPLPSNAMLRRLERMWCDSFGPKHSEWNEVREELFGALQKVQRNTADVLRSRCPTLALAPFIEVSVVGVDEAWLRAAIRVRGRPAFRSETFEPFYSDESCATKTDWAHASWARGRELPRFRTYLARMFPQTTFDDDDDVLAETDLSTFPGERRGQVHRLSERPSVTNITPIGWADDIEEDTSTFRRMSARRSTTETVDWLRSSFQRKGYELDTDEETEIEILED